MRHAVVVWKNLDHLGFFNKHLNPSTKVFLQFAPIEMRSRGWDLIQQPRDFPSSENINLLLASACYITCSKSA